MGPDEPEHATEELVDERELSRASSMVERVVAGQVQYGSNWTLQAADMMFICPGAHFAQG